MLVRLCTHQEAS